MSDVKTALSQIAIIRSQIAFGANFKGIAPSSNVVFGVLALGVCLWQVFRPQTLQPMPYIELWGRYLLTVVSIALYIAVIRAKRFHGAMASSMLLATSNRVLPFLVAGLVISCVVSRFTPESVWLLPGIWQMLIGLVGFALINILPPRIVVPSIWYFVCGALVMMLAASGKQFSPWMMGVPFGVGQLLVAAILSNSEGAWHVAKK